MTSKINGLPPISTTADLPAVIGRKAGAAKSEAGVADTDRLDLTASARVLGDSGTDAPIDSARVDKLRQAIADGSYRIDADRIAGRLLDLERTSHKD